MAKIKKINVKMRGAFDRQKYETANEMGITLNGGYDPGYASKSMDQSVGNMLDKMAEPTDADGTGPAPEKK